MKWIMMFRRAKDPDGGRICWTAECPEEELIGEKERAAAELERNSGEAWICVTVVRIGVGKPEDAEGRREK